jgi:hypothetical protein
VFGMHKDGRSQLKGPRRRSFSLKLLWKGVGKRERDGDTGRLPVLVEMLRGILSTRGPSKL